jgi:acyl carrier protein
MITKELTTVLLEILEEDYLISHDRLKEEYWDMPLTGKHFRLSGFELAALVLEFEKRTGIMIDINEKPMYALASINDIIKSISQGEFATNN